MTVLARPLLFCLVGSLTVVVAGCAEDIEERDIFSNRVIVEEEVVVTPPAWCAGATAHRYDPASAEDYDMFPDALLEAQDDASPTGIRLLLNAETAPWTVGAPALIQDAIAAANGLTGFGTMGAVVMRFDEPVLSVPITAAESLGSTAFQWWDVSASPAERVAFESVIQEGGLTLVFWPLLPLDLASEYAFVVTTEAAADDGGCISPAPATRSLLWGDVDASVSATVATRMRDALPNIGLAAENVSAFTVFTTHDETGAMRQRAAEIADITGEWVSDASCTQSANFRRCEREIMIRDYRDEDGIVRGDTTASEARIIVSSWIPAEGTGPWPTIMYGHGLNSTRSEAGRVASLLSGQDVVIVAMDAVEHGEHPSVPDDGLEDALRFLGIDLAALSIDAAALRGNIEQTVLDRLQLLRVIQDAPDIDGDGSQDVNSDQLGYMGVSLGALLGTPLLALQSDIDAAVLTIGGARLMSVVTDGDVVQDFEPIIANLVGSLERFDRLVPFAQHIVDAADPGLWAAHVLHDRFDDAEPPHLLVVVAIADEVVPPASGRALARALGVPHVYPVAEPVAMLPQAGFTPVSLNWQAGTRTAGFFQFDRVTRGEGVTTAQHVSTPLSDEGILQLQVFFETFVQDGAPQIVDPYEIMGTPPL
ncbi:MAG: hypothetical protein ACJA1R_002554 [Flavobacteriales bacterium]|jgi:hypothetical protein